MYIHNSAVPHCMAAQPWISSIAIAIRMKYYITITITICCISIIGPILNTTVLL